MGVFSGDIGAFRGKGCGLDVSKNGVRTIQGVRSFISGCGGGSTAVPREWVWSREGGADHGAEASEEKTVIREDGVGAISQADYPLTDMDKGKRRVRKEAHGHPEGKNSSMSSLRETGRPVPPSGGQFG